MATKDTKEFISDNWLWFVGGAVVIGIVASAAIMGNHAPSTEEYFRKFESAMMRYKPLEDYSESDKKTIISCMFYSGSLLNYRNTIRTKNETNDSFISTYTPVPDEDIYTSLSKYVDGDSGALMNEEKRILNEDLSSCTK